MAWRWADPSWKHKFVVQTMSLCISALSISGSLSCKPFFLPILIKSWLSGDSRMVPQANSGKVLTSCKQIHDQRLWDDTQDAYAVCIAWLWAQALTDDSFFNGAECFKHILAGLCDVTWHCIPYICWFVRTLTSAPWSPDSLSQVRQKLRLCHGDRTIYILRLL